MSQFDPQSVTDRQLQLAIIAKLDRGSTTSKFFPNVHHGLFERDLLRAMNDSHHWHEFEIKRSRSDYRADYSKSWPGHAHRFRYDDEDQKQLKHDVLQAGEFSPGVELRKPGWWCQPRYFWFVLPEEMIDLQEIPGPYGVLRYSMSNRGRIKIDQERGPSPLPNATKLSAVDKQRLMRSVYYRFWRHNIED